MDKKGLLLCARYAVSPNLLGYCGPSKSSNLIDHLKENIADREVSHILSEFETLYPYLKLIASINKITDFFNKDVVEAYWIGNSLLNNISNKDYFYFLKELLRLERKLNKKNFQKLKEKILIYSFLPHHSFHVFNIFRRTGKDPSFQTLETMNECRIGWGNVKEIITNKDSGLSRLIVESNKLKINNGQLVLAKPMMKQIRLDFKGKKLMKKIKKGDWVSFHWGYLCDVLTNKQVANLEYYTKGAIKLFNTKI